MASKKHHSKTISPVRRKGSRPSLEDFVILCCVVTPHKKLDMNILLMEEFSAPPDSSPYFTIIYSAFYIPGGAGFLPSTVAPDKVGFYLVIFLEIPKKVFLLKVSIL